MKNDLIKPPHALRIDADEPPGIRCQKKDHGKPAKAEISKVPEAFRHVMEDGSLCGFEHKEVSPNAVSPLDFLSIPHHPTLVAAPDRPRLSPGQSVVSDPRVERKKTLRSP